MNNKGYLLRKNLDIVDVISFVRVDPPGLASKNIKVPTNTVDIKENPNCIIFTHGAIINVLHLISEINYIFSTIIEHTE